MGRSLKAISIPAYPWVGDEWRRRWLIGLVITLLVVTGSAPALAAVSVPLPAATVLGDQALGREIRLQGLKWAEFDRAWEAFSAGDLQEAVGTWHRLAQQGMPEAQLRLGLMLDHGLGVEQDAVAAVHWIGEAARTGFADAQFLLGVAYANGSGTVRDPARSRYWWRQAALQGSIDAQFNLGLVYSIGQDVERDLGEAARWWQAAAHAGDQTAQFNLGLMYARGLGVEQDLERAIRWWRSAAAQGNARARAVLESFRVVGN